MPVLQLLIARLAAVFRGAKLDSEMDEEMRWHVDMETERNRREGMSPDEARCAARRQFGGLDQLKERERDARTWTWPEQLAKDCRYAFRSLAKSPNIAAAAHNEPAVIRERSASRDLQPGHARSCAANVRDVQGKRTIGSSATNDGSGASSPFGTAKGEL